MTSLMIRAKGRSIHRILLMSCLTALSLFGYSVETVQGGRGHGHGRGHSHGRFMCAKRYRWYRYKRKHNGCQGCWYWRKYYDGCFSEDNYYEDPSSETTKDEVTTAPSSALLLGGPTNDGNDSKETQVTTSAPSPTPFPEPSLAPSTSSKDGYVERLDQGVLFSGCEEPLPQNASSLVSQRIAYQFHLYTIGNSLPTLQLETWKKNLHFALSDRFLNDCRYNNVEDVMVQSLESPRMDSQKGSCSSDGDANYCHIVEGETFVNLFSMQTTRRRRQRVLLFETITDLRVAEEFLKSFQAFCSASGEWEGDLDITGCQFKGFTNGGAEEMTFEGDRGDGRDATGTSGAAAAVFGQSDNSSGSRKSTIGGAFAVALAGVVLIVVLCIIARGRRRVENDDDIAQCNKDAASDQDVPAGDFDRNGKENDSDSTECGGRNDSRRR